jgi:hypothetical protein
MENQKLTKRQAAVIGAFTGVCCGPFADIHEYVDSLPGFKGIGTISFGDADVARQIKEASRKDFNELCYDPQGG